MTYVSIELGEPGARIAGERGDVIVLIDALRASTTITCALAAGAQRVWPVLHVGDAKALTTRHGYLCAGERGGAKVPGFDFGNSPTEMLAERDRLRGQTLVLTTSNGTRCVQAAIQAGATAVLSGALPNAAPAALAAWRLADRHGRHITLLAAGLDDEVAIEDMFAARWLLQALVSLGQQAGVPVGHAPFESVAAADSAEVFRTSEAGIRLTGLGYAADVAYCARIDMLRILPLYRAEVGFAPWTGEPEETSDD